MSRPAAAATALVLGAAAAQAEQKLPAPDYFVETIVATTTAQNIALACPRLSFELLVASRRSGEVIARLAEDGFDAKNLEATMEDPADRIRTLQQAFLEKHDLPRDGADLESVCAAGLAEIAEGTAIGGFLVEISGEGAIDPTEDQQE